MDKWELLKWRWKYIIDMTCSFFQNSFGSAVTILSTFRSSRPQQSDSKDSEMGWIVFQQQS